MTPIERLCELSEAIGRSHERFEASRSPAVMEIEGRTLLKLIAERKELLKELGQ